MKHLLRRIGRPTGWLMLLLTSLVAGLLPNTTRAHPMPNSVVLLTVHADHIDAEVQIPLSELQAAIGQSVHDSAVRLVERLGPSLRTYLIRHVRPQTPAGQPWKVSIGALQVQETRNPINGLYRELTAKLQFFPPGRSARSAGEVRRFVLHYDAVLHQVITHKILVSVQQDWARGQLAEETPAQVGVIELDIVHNRVEPLVVNLGPGSNWTGFRAMVQLGIHHIGEGTDHLLFLLVLLLPAPLLIHNGRWSRFGGVRYSLKRLLRVITAFTLGHSLTLLLGTLGWVRLPSQPVEVLIAVSILVSASHAVRPLFANRTAIGRETGIAAGFGLVHGLAFADTLANLHLETGLLALSILGFNLGIELMQLFVIVLTIPWLMLLSRTPAYPAVRLTGALLAAVAALAWVAERVSGRVNPLTRGIEQAATQAPCLLALLALLALFCTWRTNSAGKLPFSS
ncbi:HupE/UreJ family protein [Larkinella insperata]|uniref:HupE/UreJ family protein n=1 Tax=Larkinella insperata TaxID=332158 RepID=A0ABW3QFE8_9BACT|nr:HupE/UreJ family protein [Larkinella insperata]